MTLLSSTSARSISSKNGQSFGQRANRKLDAPQMYLLAMGLWFQEYHDYPGSAQWCDTHTSQGGTKARQKDFLIIWHLALRHTESYCKVNSDARTDGSMDDVQAEKVSAVWKKALDQEVANSRHYFLNARCGRRRRRLCLARGSSSSGL